MRARVKRIGAVVVDMTPGAKIAFTFLTLAVALSLAWTSFQNREITECQSKYNAAVTKVLRERAVLNEADRQSVANLARSLLELPTQDARRRALEEYVLTQDRITRQREATPLPNIPDCNSKTLLSEEKPK
jgi:hypothetical protein